MMSATPSLPSFEEREPYEKGFSAYYQKKIVPIIMDLEKSREEKRTLYHSRLRKAVPFAILASVGALALSLATQEVRIFLGLAAISWGIAWTWANAPVRAYKQEMKSHFLPVVCEFFGKMSFQEASQSSLETDYSGEIFPSFTQCQQEDFIEGDYRGTAIHVHESLLTRKVRSRRGSYNVTVFRGLVLKIKPPKQFTGKTLLIKDAGSIGNFFTGKDFRGLQRVELEDPEFEKIFQVFSSDQLEARYLLSTAFMEHLLKLARLRSPNSTPSIQCVFEKDQLVIAIPSGQNLFEPQSINRSVLDAEDLHTFLAQMQEIFNLIEVLFPKFAKKL